MWKRSYDLHSRPQLDHVLVHMLQTKCYHGTEKLLQITQHVCTVLGLRMFAVNMHLNKIVESCERMVVQAQLMQHEAESVALTESCAYSGRNYSCP